ncbi:hypothetical protein QVD17_15459 [Tagetes erecta]|uniref:Uncharacterized protein n=1 Tax=Tagetes erecta TaxID=13708 RepID=A0AAD8KP96_TARER|nr:hypothetical protein QVD17_15459 [Tagetes erecta]
MRPDLCEETKLQVGTMFLNRAVRPSTSAVHCRRPAAVHCRPLPPSPLSSTADVLVAVRCQAEVYRKDIIALARGAEEEDGGGEKGVMVVGNGGR